jgi:signal peptidase
MKSFFSIFYYVVALGALALGALLVLLQTALLPGYEVLIVQSGSMEPAISTGSVVVVSEQDRYEAGEVITFGETTGDQVPTTHRVVSEQLLDGEYAYTTKGDANEEADLEPVPLNEVRGKVLFAIPWLGFILDFARQPLGFVLLIGIPAALIAIEEISNLYSVLRGKPEEEDDDQSNKKNVEDDDSEDRANQKAESPTTNK